MVTHSAKRHKAVIMIYILVGISFLMAPLVMVYMEYRDLDEESFERWLFGQSFSNIIRMQTAVQFGCLLILFGLFIKLAVWR